MSTEKTPISAAGSSFDNTDTHPAITPSPTAPSSTLEISPEKHDAKDGSDDGTGHVHELHARPDTATEYQEFMNLHQRFNGSKEWSKVLWKMDIRILPPLAIAYLLAFLDRGNIGNAKVAGLTVTIPMSDALYNTGLAAFFILYILFEIPAQFFLKRFGARWWISGMVIACGIVMSTAASISSPAGFILFRLFLGLCESGIMPGVNEILSCWYTQLARRVAIFFSSASLAGAFSGILAYGITGLEGRYGIEGWRWLFLIEGVMTFGCGILGPLLIVGYPKDKHGWLSQDEQRYLMLRQRFSTNGQTTARGESNAPGLVTEVAKRWHIYPQMIIYFSHSLYKYLLGYSITFTLPVIVRSLKFSKIESYLIPVPIYFGACLWTILNCHISDKRKRRAEHVAGPFLLGILGLIFTIGARAKPGLIGLTMTGLVFIVFGAYSATPPSLAWTASNFPEPHKHVAFGFQLAFGAFGGLTGSFIYLSKESPLFDTGYIVSLVVASIATVCCIVLKIGYDRANKQRDALSKEAIEEQWSEKDIAAAGDRSPYFRYWS
ncbi:MFS general substrate transporter [Filobasidium floriforme]|uniref:MFS general substrate transporter n=1 Tax=Filobasidium floriforme TaxID=5210 RepID=UPI001E8D4B98|nr:MFS general substrate transporter [Filobasidium floriforme]KAH8078634.1 MFS general substrate transporter [Filobasidium floriforme]